MDITVKNDMYFQNALCLLLINQNKSIINNKTPPVDDCVVKIVIMNMVFFLHNNLLFISIFKNKAMATKHANGPGSQAKPPFRMDCGSIL